MLGEEKKKKKQKFCSELNYARSKSGKVDCKNQKEKVSFTIDIRSKARNPIMGKIRTKKKRQGKFVCYCEDEEQ